MAFGGVLLVNSILLIVCIMAVIGVVFLVVCAVLAVMSIMKKVRGHLVKKRYVVISVICGIAGLVFLFLPAMFFLTIMLNKITIETGKGEVRVYENVAEQFGYAVNRDDVRMVQEMLEKCPELIDYTMDSKTPLGVAIDAEAILVARYLLEYGVDVDRVDKLSFDTSMTLAARNLKFRDWEFSVEMLHLLMDYDARMNDKINGTTPVQYLISYIIDDLRITSEEMELLERFLNKGAYLTIEDMSGDDALVCFEKALENKELTKEQEKEIQKIRELLKKYYEQQKAEVENMSISELTFQELANILADIGVADISPERISELEKNWEEFPEEARESMDRVALLLTAAGEGRYDYRTGKWTPTSEAVYCFDMEAFDIDNMYSILFQGIETISKNAMIFTEVEQDDGASYYDRRVLFKMNGAPYEFKAEFGGDWYDASIVMPIGLRNFLRKQAACWFRTPNKNTLLSIGCKILSGILC